MKNTRKCLFIFVGVMLINATGVLAKQETNSLTIMSFYVFEHPLAITNTSPLNPDDPSAKLPFVSLQFVFWKCVNWDQVLAIHTPSSINVLEKLKMRERFEEARMRQGGTNAYEQTFTAFVHFRDCGQERMLAQSVPFITTKEKLSEVGAYRVQGYTKIGNEWKIDKTLQSSELAALLVNSTPSELGKIEEWVRVTKQTREQ